MNGGKPFSSTPGRDVSRDRPSTFDVARSYYEQRHRIAEDAAALHRLRAAVDWTGDLAPAQWAQWYSVTLGFSPDLIVELGRGHGNSTALFGQAAWRLGRTKVVSLCRTGEWTSVVAPRIAQIVDAAWFANIDARRIDILSADYAEIIADHQRVLLLWDAHGFEIAELVLGEILPRLADRQHLVLMHDISDNRYAAVTRSYGGHPLMEGEQMAAGGCRRQPREHRMDEFGPGSGDCPRRFLGAKRLGDRVGRSRVRAVLRRPSAVTRRRCVNEWVMSSSPSWVSGHSSR